MKHISTVVITLNEYEKLKRCELKCDNYYTNKLIELSTYLSQNGVSSDFQESAKYNTNAVALRNLLREEYWNIEKGAKNV